MDTQDEKFGPHSVSDILWYFSGQIGRCQRCGLEGSRVQLAEALSCPAIYVSSPLHPRDRKFSVEL